MLKSFNKTLFFLVLVFALGCSDDSSDKDTASNNTANNTANNSASNADNNQPPDKWTMDFGTNGSVAGFSATKSLLTGQNGAKDVFKLNFSGLKGSWSVSLFELDGQPTVGTYESNMIVSFFVPDFAPNCSWSDDTEIPPEGTVKIILTKSDETSVEGTLEVAGITCTDGKVFDASGTFKTL